MSTRRQFLTAAAATTTTALAAAQSSKINIGLIGCGGYGMTDLKAACAVGGVEAVAICDVDTAHLEAAAVEIEKLQSSRPKHYADYRELLEHPELQAVIIATPPHWHALQFIDACKKGLDIYEEKPLSYDVREGRAMVDAANQAGNIVQIGFQRRQSPNFQAANEYIRAGKAGRIVQVDVNIHFSARTPDPTPQAPPSTLDWDTWCGPGPKLPYSPAIAHRSWRLEAAYGNGHLVDWGIHLIDQVRVALGETMPQSVVAVGGLYQLKGKITTPDTLTAHFEFAKAPVVWRHRLWGSAEYDSSITNGIFYYGENETVFATDRRWVVIPKGRDAEHREMVEEDRHAGQAHMAEFLDAVRSRNQPSCQPEDGHYSTATVQLGMIAYQTGSRIRWDQNTNSIPNNANANALLLRPYRSPYKHPFSS